MQNHLHDIALAALLLLPGCCAQAPDSPPAPPPGVPQGATWLTGGTTIDVEAPAEGEIYLVVDGEVRTIRHVVAGERFVAVGDPIPRDIQKEQERPRGNPLHFDHADVFFLPRAFEKFEGENR